MRFMFYRHDSFPIDVAGTVTVFNNVNRPVPRIGEKVVLDADTYTVMDVIHIVQGEAEVRIYVEKVT